MIFRILAVLLVFCAPALAGVQPEERLKDDALQTRAEALYAGLRCVVCQSQSIADSNSEVAMAMRAAVRARLKTGDSDEEIFSWMQERYGDVVLMRPPVKPRTWFLWFAPLIVFLGGAAMIARTMGAGKRRKGEAA